MAYPYKQPVTNKPAHARIHLSPTDGGFQLNHLQFMVMVLEKSKGRKPPKLDYHSPTQVADYMVSHFTNIEIDNAHEEVKEIYRSSQRPNKYGRRAPQIPFPAADRDYNKGETPVEPAPSNVNLTPLSVIPESESNNNAQQNSDPAFYVTRPEFNAAIVRISDEHHNLAVADNNIRNLCLEITVKLAELNEKITLNTPVVVEIKRPELPSINLGVQHKHFPLLLQSSIATLRSGNHLNIWLYGPAGTGKTTAAERLADALFPDMPNNYYYNGAISTAFQLMGYMDAKGEYVSTAFRKAWEHGGVYLFDEIDGSMPDALLAMNGALANSIASFPDKMVPRHANCIIIAGANTTGLGGGIEYVGAMKQNAAFLDRFVQIPWPHDDALENALCANKEWLERVRYVRQRWQKASIKGHMVTMRATLYGESLLAAGIDQANVELLTLRKGLSDDQWKQIS